jgi:hypothetical protein|tara:strand:+ start:4388 stop:5041 length:654 start_codon:yes stop_codon:yes gene_type:complete
MENPNYYAILSAEVRYDNRLRPNVKLLYAEITALCNMNMECFASNSYFANLYGKSKGSISGWIGELVKHGYISTEYSYKLGTKEIEYRYIKILKGGITEKDNTLLKKTVKNNTTSTNNTSININISNRRESFILEIMSFDYDKNILNGFIDYWTEPTQSKTNPKMKWELCKTWSTNLRLKNWIANEKKWKPIKINKNKLTKNIDTMKNVLNKLNGHD